MASLIGVPLYCDKATAEGARLSYARVFVEISAHTTLPETIQVEVEGGKKIDVQVEYEWQPPRCTKCKSFGHIDAQCPVSFKAVWVAKVADQEACNTTREGTATQNQEPSNMRDNLQVDVQLNISGVENTQESQADYQADLAQHRHMEEQMISQHVRACRLEKERQGMTQMNDGNTGSQAETQAEKQDHSNLAAADMHSNTDTHSNYTGNLQVEMQLKSPGGENTPERQAENLVDLSQHSHMEEQMISQYVRGCSLEEEMQGMNQMKEGNIGSQAEAQAEKQDHSILAAADMHSNTDTHSNDTGIAQPGIQYLNMQAAQNLHTPPVNDARQNSTGQAEYFRSDMQPDRGDQNDNQPDDQPPTPISMPNPNWDTEIQHAKAAIPKKTTSSKLPPRRSVRVSKGVSSTK